MKTKADISGRKPGRSKAAGQVTPSGQVVQDAAWEAEKRWFEENRSLDAFSLFAKYFQRLC